MTLEISEIGVRMAVGEPSGASAGRAGGDSGNGPIRSTPPMPDQMEEIVSRCVRDVLRTLRMQEER